MHQRESRNSRKEMDMLCDQISRVVHLDQRFKVDLRLIKSQIYYNVGEILNKPKTWTVNSRYKNKNNLFS